MRLLLAALLLTAVSASQAPQLAPYAKDLEHPANRIFRAIFTAELVPSEIAAVLPREHGADAEFYAPGWYFAKRPGEESDRQWFGGDGRQIPREHFTAEEAAHLAADLEALRGEVLATLRADPRLAVFLQHDLLRLARRLLDTKQNAELLPALAAAAERLALPAAVLQDGKLATFALADVTTHLHGIAVADLVEIDRRSTRLFDAERTQMWSSLWIALPKSSDLDMAALLTTLAKATRDDLPTLPIGTTAVLAQGIVALDDQGQPRATDVIVDVRLQRLTNRDPLSADNATTTRDGVDFLQWLLPRQAVRESHGEAMQLSSFRAVPMATPELFRDYGTLKFTTYAGQCSLCHRRSNAPEEPLAGFSALRPGASPRPVATPDARRRLAEQQFAKFLAALPAAR